MEAVWLAALPRLRQRLGERNFATWIEPIRCSTDEHGWRLEVASRFSQRWVTQHFLPSIREALQEETRGAAAVRVVVAAAAAPAKEPSAPPVLPPPGGAAAAPTTRARQPKIGHLVAEYTFDNFVVGPANEVACQAARAVAAAPGRRFNPLFLWGGVGLGKTHLLNALAHEVLAQPTRRRLACLSAEAFMNALIASLRQDQMAAFRDRFRAVDVLILDDVQFLAGKERTQEELFHTFNALHTAAKQVVLTSDNPPNAITGLEQRLRSRFEGGLIADVLPPTRSMRVAIVIRKAALQGVELPNEVAGAIADRSGPSVRELEGALTRTLAASLLQDRPLSVELVHRVLAPVAPVRGTIPIEAIQHAVSEHFRVSVGDLKSHRRDREVLPARQVAMYLSRTLAEASFPAIAEKFGGRDHSTVMHAVRVMEEKRTCDPDTAQLLLRLEETLRRPLP